MADTIVCSMRYRVHFGLRITCYAGKPAVTSFLPFIDVLLTLCRWLIDTDRDAEGMRVLADLHGGDLNDPIAVAEFKEIKEKVQEEVRIVHMFLI